MSFQFKQFTVNHHRCAQKVGTDGVLLGAWAPISGHRILDVGTGCGLIALMLAQRIPEAHIVAIDIDQDSVDQAYDNFLSSPWHDRLQATHVDFRLFPDSLGTFDAIISNPPFFVNALNCPDERRNAARHTVSLPLNDLAIGAFSLLRPGGSLSVILPFDVTSDFITYCLHVDLRLSHRTDVHTTKNKLPKRSLLHFLKGQSVSTNYEHLVLSQPDGSRTPEHHELTKFFYIK